jgi:hypothetical protein
MRDAQLSAHEKYDTRDRKPLGDSYPRASVSLPFWLKKRLRNDRTRERIALNRLQKLPQGSGAVQRAENTWKGQQSEFSLSMITSRFGESSVERLVECGTPR